MNSFDLFILRYTVIVLIFCHCRKVRRYESSYKHYGLKMASSKHGIFIESGIRNYVVFLLKCFVIALVDYIRERKIHLDHRYFSSPNLYNPAKNIHEGKNFSNCQNYIGLQDHFRNKRNYFHLYSWPSMNHYPKVYFMDSSTNHT